MKMMNSKEPIVALHMANQEVIKVGYIYFDVDRTAAHIVSYEENGEMAPTVWFRVTTKDGRLLLRVNSKHVAYVEY